MAYSILSELDRDSVAAEIELLRAATNKSVLVLEGPNDEKFIEHFIASNACEIVIAGGKENSLGSLVIVRRRGIGGVLYIVDQDFDEFMQIHHLDANVITTDEHDVEMMMFKSTALDKVLGELGSEAKLAGLAEKQTDVRTLTINAIHPLGILRLFSIITNANLRFEDLKYRFVDKQLSAAPDDMIEEVFNHSQIFAYDRPAVKEYIKSWQAKPHDQWLMCCGHDVVAVLGKALQSLIGSQNATKVAAEEIKSRLRLAYSAEDLLNTRLYAEVLNWEFSNPPFRCLRV